MHGRFGNNQTEAGEARGRGMRTGTPNACGEAGAAVGRGRGGGLGRNFAKRNPSECTASKEQLEAQREMLKNRIEMIDKKLETV